MDDALFPDLVPPPAQSTGDPGGVPRYQPPNREQVELYPCHLDRVLPPDHAARLVWRFVEGLNVGPFYDAIAARGSRPGRAPIDPRILLALWLYATIDGVGSARELDRLCKHHDAYRWLCGGVSVNYGSLNTFRTAHQAALDDLLTQSITVLLHKRVVTLARVAQDGTRVRASAGAASFRRQGTLEQCRQAARRQVERTQRQADAGAATRTQAAQHRAAVDRLERVEAALAELPALAAVKARRNGTPRAPRVSTTDPVSPPFKKRRNLDRWSTSRRAVPVTGRPAAFSG